MLDIRQRTGYLFLAIVVGHIVLISAQVNASTGSSVLEAVLFGTFSRVQGATAAVLDGITGVWTGYVDLRRVREENERLEQSLAELRVRLQQERALANESRQLRALLELRDDMELPTMAADVIAADATPWFRTITINKGTADGLARDMAVVSPAGVVGRVVGEVSRHAAKVQLIIDRNAAAGALIERTRAGGVVVGGQGDPPLQMEYVSNLEVIEPGDVVVTSGIDGIYPKGFIIGRVHSVERGAGMYKSIRVTPAVDFTRLEEVLVVLRSPAAELAAEATE